MYTTRQKAKQLTIDHICLEIHETIERAAMNYQTSASIEFCHTVPKQLGFNSHTRTELVKAILSEYFSSFTTHWSSNLHGPGLILTISWPIDLEDIKKESRFSLERID